MRQRPRSRNLEVTPSGDLLNLREGLCPNDVEVLLASLLVHRLGLRLVEKEMAEDHVVGPLHGRRQNRVVVAGAFDFPQLRALHAIRFNLSFEILQ